MKARFALTALVTLTACAPLPFSRGPKPDPYLEAQYARALVLLEPGSSLAAMDSASRILDAYLATAGHVERRAEAVALRRLAGDAMQLSRVAAALHEARATADNRERGGDSVAARPDGDSLKEIQRLRDELAEARAELERIRKRLATQKP